MRAALPLLLCPLALTPAFADCTGPSAVIEGGFTISGAYSYEYHQRMVLVRRGGTGNIGRWTGIEYTQTMHYSISIDRPVFLELVAGIESSIPSMNANCLGRLVDPHTIVVHCIGEFDYDVAADGAIRWADRPLRVGRLTPAQGGATAQMTIDMLAGAPTPPPPAMDSTMTGSVDAGPPFDLRAQITSRTLGLGGSGSPGHTEMIIEGSVNPPIEDSSAFLLSAQTDTATAVVVPLTTNSTRVRLLGGNASQRMRAAEQVTVNGSLEVGPCTIEESWSLAELIREAGLRP